ncbi:hypothetical protein CGZ93_17350 [Enemella dayhoffiae]|uniref:Integral membrane bound transporter domain-containing protein n=1 Tax=Enemella dayhoffiae TaxID=2016507 RepID=A0A255GMA9_9ACTN|nr:FUSC family protein [Enemella dayhoffiae]OYO16532.1 hypothetical protein CGZ93_17350 [Enemella dayhoffiae]
MHPFGRSSNPAPRDRWAGLVVLVLSYPGAPGTLLIRALSRILGTLVGLLLFIPFAGRHLGPVVFVSALCVLLWFVARWTSRNYLIGSVLITLLTLFMSLPLMPDQTPLQLACDRGVDTVIAGVIAVATLWALRGRSARSRRYR